MGIGETLRRALYKLVMRAAGDQAKTVCGNLQLCAGLEACTRLEVPTRRLCLVPLCPHYKFSKGPAECLPYALPIRR